VEVDAGSALRSEKSGRVKGMITGLWLSCRVQSRWAKHSALLQTSWVPRKCLLHKQVVATTVAMADHCHTMEARQVIAIEQ
jgi:hypothetical protein